jgi:hypothetical protein
LVRSAVAEGAAAPGFSGALGFVRSAAAKRVGAADFRFVRSLGARRLAAAGCAAGLGFV